MSEQICCHHTLTPNDRIRCVVKTQQSARIHITPGSSYYIFEPKKPIQIVTQQKRLQIIDNQFFQRTYQRLNEIVAS